MARISAKPPYACPWYLMALLPGLLWGGSVKSLPFRSRETPPATVIPARYARYEAPLRNALTRMPEAGLLRTALTVGGRELGLTFQEIKTLNTRIARVYGDMAGDPSFARLPSALAYGFSTTPPERGHYFLVQPEMLPAKPDCIVFLHGFGGNLQLYSWLLAQAFPDAVILVPSWGMTWYAGSPVYLADMLSDAEQRLGRTLARPWLIGMSEGGRGGLEIYNRMPDRFEGMIWLANVPEPQQLATMRREMKLLMINGRKDQMVPVTLARERAALLRTRLSDFVFEEIRGDHFFLLTNPAPAFEIIRQFMKRCSVKN